MATYDITLRDTADRGGATPVVTEVVVADAYQQEGPMTTFFRLDAQRTVIDCWSTRVASFRTADVVAVRLAPDAGHRTRRAARADVRDCGERDHALGLAAS